MATLKCDRCGKDINQGDKYFTAVGMVQCEECDKANGGTISLDFILDHIIKDEKERKANE
jgi:hypothetical protein